MYVLKGQLNDTLKTLISREKRQKDSLHPRWGLYKKKGLIIRARYVVTLRLSTLKTSITSHVFTRTAPSFLSAN